MADPQKMRAEVVPVVADTHGLGLFIGQEQALVRGEQLAASEALRVGGARGLHKLNGLADALNHALVLCAAARMPHKAEIPRARAVQVGEAPGEERPHVVERGGAVVAGADHPRGVGAALVGMNAVDVVAPVAEHLTPVDDLGVVAAGLGVLPGEARDTDDGGARAPGQHHAHLQEDLELVLDGGRVAIDEALGAVAALQQEPPPQAGLAELLAQAIHLSGVHQGRQGLHLADGAVERVRIIVLRLLPDGPRAPGAEVPGVSRHHASA